MKLRGAWFLQEVLHVVWSVLEGGTVWGRQRTRQLSVSVFEGPPLVFPEQMLARDVVDLHWVVVTLADVGSVVQ